MRRVLCVAALLSVAACGSIGQPREGTLRLSDATIPYEVRGSGAPVVFIHGWTQNMSIGDDQAVLDFLGTVPALRTP